MKKIFSAVLCLILAMFMLVSCGEDIIGEYIDQYDAPTVKEKLSYNLYIICDDGTTDNAKVTVQQRIADYTASKFDTTVNVVYCSAEDYSSTILAKTADGAADQADIFLVNSEALMQNLLNEKRLADLTAYFEGKAYGTLNAQIASSLLEASMVEVEESGKTVKKNYCVPNNHVIGEYQYLIINRDTAERYYLGSDAKLASFTTYESTEALRGYISADITAGNLTGTLENYVSVVYGKYEDKAEYEAAGYACNIISKPEATKADAYSAAFAINANVTDVNRAMEIVYAINTDTTLHNYLQYGILGTNYNLDENNEENVIRVQEGNSVYRMNPLYTGDIFKMLYCEELGWLQENATYGASQNKESSFPVPETSD